MKLTGAAILVSRGLKVLQAAPAAYPYRSAPEACVTDAAEFARLLGFTPAWFALGVVDDTVLARQQAEWDKGEDDNTEHYRYWAFRDFLTARRPLAPELAEALFELGAADPDRTMGGSIMADIVHRPECPPAVLDAALASGRKHLIRIVQRRRAEPGAAADGGA